MKLENISACACILAALLAIALLSSVSFPAPDSFERSSSMIGQGTSSADQKAQEGELKAAEATELIRKGLVFIFRNRGEDGWECERLTIKPYFAIEADAGIPPKNIREWCDGADPPENLVADIADLFSHEIDFLADIAEGDSFSVYFQKEKDENGKNKLGPILAARVSIDGEDYFAFYYELPDGYAGYFDEAGKSLEKLFLKSPLNYRSITSRFSPRRLHPILRIYRPHFGIDYSAPAGTPVGAIGDGKVTFVGRKKGYGRFS